MNGSLGYIIEGSFAVGILGLIWKISIDSNKKVDTVFKRFDQHKEAIKEEFVNKDVCKILNTQMQRDIGEIKTDVKLLLRKNGFKDQ